MASTCAPRARASFMAASVSIAPLAGEVRLGRDSRPFLEQVAANEAGVVRRPAGQEDDPGEPADLVFCQVQPVELELAVVEPLADRLGDGVRLLPDLLEHERVVALLLGRLLVPLDLLHLALDHGAVAGEEGGP